MPKYYCKYCPDRFIYTDVQTSNSKFIRLNEHRGRPGTRDEAIKSIPLGDAYFALEALKRRERLSDDKNFANQYEWLFDRKFLDTWRNIAAFRNQAAHTGIIFTKTDLEKNLSMFSILMDFMPRMIELKRELAPEGYVDEVISEDTAIVIESNVDKNIETEKPSATKVIAQRYLYLYDLLNKCSCTDSDSVMNELNEIIENYSFNTTIFVDKNGKEGMRDVLGNIIIPAKFDSIAFEYNSIVFPMYSMIAKIGNKLCLVKTDGSGEELTPSIYDDIRLLPYNWGFLFKKDGSISWGVMTKSGKEIIDCIIDGYSCGASLFFRSGNYWGVWQEGRLAAPIIFDNIEVINPDEPMLFTLNNITGYVRYEDGKFVPKSEVVLTIEKWTLNGRKKTEKLAHMR